jgi:chorismate mutase/prephenate dehydrogenase
MTKKDDGKPLSRSSRGSGKTNLYRRRRAIERLDERILKLVALRMREADAIGALKRKCGTPLRNFEVEAQVVGRLERLAQEMDLGCDLGRELALFLIQRSLEMQAPVVESAYGGDLLKVLVVGGMGGMGRWIAGFLKGQGHRVQVFDPAPGECSYPRSDDLCLAARAADLVMVAVPMSACAEVLEALAECETEAVTAEMCSLKTHLQPVFAKVRSRGLRVISFHPMFGPGVTMLSGKKIVFCTGAAQRDQALVESLFRSTSAELVRMSPEEHDRRMAMVLGLSHLLNLAFAGALRSSGISCAELECVGGVTFARQMATTAEVVGENPSLYYEIQTASHRAAAHGHLLEDSVRRAREIVEAEDEPAFNEFMALAAEYVAPRPLSL